MTRLVSQGFNSHPREHPTITNTNGFEATLKQQQGLYFLTVNISPMPSNMKLDICEASHGIRSTASPVTLTQSGLEWVTHNNNMWMYDNSGYLVRVHKRTWKDLYTPDAQCPVPEAQPDNCRRTIAFKPDGTLEDFEDKYKNLPQQQKNSRFAGPAWSGETWLKAKEANKTSSTAAAQSTNSDSNTKKHQQSKQRQSSSSHKNSSLQDQQSDTANRNQWNNQWYNHSQRSNKYIQEKQFQDQRTHQQQQTIGSRKGNSIIKPTSGARGYRIDDDWTTKISATMNFTWTGSTNF